MSGPRGVVNTHWYKGSDQLPGDVLYIGRPSEYGNRHMGDDGHTREEHVALNRIDIYHQIQADPTYLDYLKTEMGGKDLACWCKSKKKLVSCHGDNYLHILSPELADRDWTKSVSVFLVGDIRLSLKKLYDAAFNDRDTNAFLPVYLDWAETKLEIEALLSLMKQEDWSLCDAHYTLACIAVDLDLAVHEPSVAGRDYRLAHAEWIMNRIFLHWKDRLHEPNPPEPVILKPKKGEATL